MVEEDQRTFAVVDQIITRDDDSNAEHIFQKALKNETNERQRIERRNEDEP